MLYPTLFFAELFLLFLLSQSVTKALSSFLYHKTKSKKITISCIALLFLPGTIIHELSHYITAKIFFVRTYGMELLPKLDGDNLKLGSVMIEKSDFFRHLLIGMAPFVTGTSILLGTLYFAAQNNLLTQPIFIVIIGYVVFEIGNTMFSSKKDMEGAIELLIALTIIFGIFSFIGIHLPPFDPELVFSNPTVMHALEKGSLFLLAPIIIDLLVIILLKLSMNNQKNHF